MSRRFQQFERRLGRLEASLGKRSQRTETSLFHQVTMEAEQELSPEELLLYRSAESARRERRFHSLEEHAVKKKFDEIRDMVARRHGFFNYMGFLQKQISSRPRLKLSAEESQEIVDILHWGRDNGFHVRRLELAREASQANCSASDDDNK